MGGRMIQAPFAFFSPVSKKANLVANTSPWLQEEYLAEMKPIEYKSRDGLTINGYLTLPVGVEAKNLPVVVNPHGGPWARDSWGFNPEAQFLANRGVCRAANEFPRVCGLRQIL